jgi:Cadherin domain
MSRSLLDSSRHSATPGTNWIALDTVANTTARLLNASARLYFQPNSNYNGTIANAITFRAWDMTSGTNGAIADTTTNGGSTAFSSLTDTAAITITAVNDAPVLTLSNLTNVTENVQGAVIADVLTTDAENNAITYTIKVNGVLDDRFEVVAGKLKLKSTVSLDYEAAASLNLEVIATDNGSPSRSASSLFTLAINDTNEKPLIQNLPTTTIQAISGQAIAPIRFLVTDPNQPNANLINVTVRTKNQTLIPARNVRFSGTGTERFLTFTPSALLSGNTNLIVVVKGHNGEITEQTIAVQVTPPRRTGFIKRLLTIRTGI